MPTRMPEWTEPGLAHALCSIIINEKKGGKHFQLPQSVYREVIAPFLQFDGPVPGQLYVLGGRDENQDPLDTVEMFDTWHGRWISCPSMKTRRAGCSAAALPDGRLLVIGGYDYRGIVSGVLSSCEVFDPATQEWSPYVGDLVRGRWGHGCAVLNQRIYVVGGCSLTPGQLMEEENMETLRVCEVYDPTIDSWSTCAPLNTPRAGARVVAIVNDQIVAVGGCDDVFGRAELLDTLEVYSERTKQWSIFATHMGIPRTTAATVALDESHILVVGGAPSLACGEVLDMSEKGAPSESSTIPEMVEGRMGCQAVTLDLRVSEPSGGALLRKCVVVVGGENGDDDISDMESSEDCAEMLESVLVFDTVQGTWLEQDAFPPIPTPRTAMALCVAPGLLKGWPS